MCEIAITFTDWKADDIVLKLAEYIEQGFTLRNVETQYCSREKRVTVELVKYKK
jgi:hypothetical protein